MSGRGDGRSAPRGDPGLLLPASLATTLLLTALHSGVAVAQNGSPDGARPGEAAVRAGSSPSWQVRSPDLLGMDPARLEQAYRQADWMKPLTSLLVARHGELVAEKYWRGLGPHDGVNVKSISKAILSALVGIALEQGHLRSLDQKVVDFLPEYFEAETDPRKRDITLRHLLTMRSGLETTSFHNYGRWVSQTDWVRGVLEQPVVADPGSEMIYSTGSAHLLAVILHRATGESTLEFARRQLFAPLGIRLDGWQRSPRGRYFGGNNMSLSPRDLLRFGQLYLEDGVHGGERILPAGWVSESWRKHAVSRWNGYDYGYYWWGRELAGHEVRYAWGYGGQFLFVVPSLDLVVAATSEISADGNGWGHRSKIYWLMERYLIPAVKEPASPARLRR